MKRHLPILVLCICMVAVVLICLSRQISENLLTYVHFYDAVTNRELAPFYDETENKYYLFLPAYTSRETVNVTFDIGGRVEFISETVSFGNDLSDVPLNEDVTLCASFLFYRQSATVQFLQCAGLPTLCIDAKPEVISFLNESKENRSDVKVTVYDPRGAVLLEDVAELSGRGNSSWDNQAKRPYELQFDHSVTVGELQNVPRLCLLAEYADESKLHNSLAYYGARLLGIPYASGYEFVDLYVNGEYQGLYGLATKDTYLEYVDEENIRSVFEVTSNTEKQDFRPGLGQNPVRVLYGNVEQAKAAVASFEEALLGENWEALAEIIDVGSFARKYVMEELFANSDMTFASQYYYLDAQNKLHCMLPWDYDLSLGYAFRYYNNKQIYEIESSKDPTGWYSMLTGFTPFRTAVTGVLEAMCGPDFVAALENHMWEDAEKIETSWAHDRLRWRSERPFNWFDRTCGEETLEGMVTLYSGYFPQRIAFLKDYFYNWESYCLVAFDGIQYGNLCIPKEDSLWSYLEGATILEGEKLDASFQGWYTESGIPVEDVKTVTEDMVFYPKYDIQEGG